MILAVVEWVVYTTGWFLGVIVWGGTADKLNPGGVCFFGKHSTCTAIVFFGVIAWLVLTLALIWRIAERLDPKHELPTFTEARAFACMTAAWGLIALIIAITNPGSTPNSTALAVIAFSWVNLLVHIIGTAVITIRYRQELDD